MKRKHDDKRPESRLARRRRLTRRGFFKVSGAAATVVTTGFGTTAFGAPDIPRVSEDGPIAIALNYVHDARTVDAAKRLSDRFCHNCALYAGSPEDEWAKCSVFPGKLVAGEGWCSVWAPKQQS